MQATGIESETRMKPDLGRWRAGNTDVEGVWQFKSDAAGRHVLITALLHGNEFSGARAVLRLLEHGLRPKHGSLTVAFCNLEAFDHFDARLPDSSRFVEEDMNRVWTLARLGDPSTAERRRAVQLLPFITQADWLLDLHSMHEPSEPLLLTGLSKRNLSVARRLGVPGHVVIDEGHADGRRLRDFGQFSPEGREDAVALLLEAGYHFDPRSDDMALHMLGRFLCLSGVLEPQQIPDDWLQPVPAGQVELTVTHAVVARSRDFRFVEDYRGLEVIECAGTVIGHDGDTPVRTPYDHCVLVMPSLRQLKPGVTVVRLASRQPSAILGK